MALNIVLLQPEIPGNAGNIARTCSCIGATLHLVDPLGFQLTQRMVKRAGLDYWDKVDIIRYPSTEAFFEQHEDAPFYLFTGRTDRQFDSVVYESDAYLVFGRESTGIDAEVLAAYPERCVRIPMIEGLRSLNLSNAVAIAAYGVLRQFDYPGLV